MAGSKADEKDVEMAETKVDQLVCKTVDLWVEWMVALTVGVMVDRKAN